MSGTSAAACPAGGGRALGRGRQGYGRDVDAEGLWRGCRRESTAWLGAGDCGWLMVGWNENE